MEEGGALFWQLLRLRLLYAHLSHKDKVYFIICVLQQERLSVRTDKAARED